MLKFECLMLVLAMDGSPEGSLSNRLDHLQRKLGRIIRKSTTTPAEVAPALQFAIPTPKGSSSSSSATPGKRPPSFPPPAELLERLHAERERKHRGPVEPNYPPPARLHRAPEKRPPSTPPPPELLKTMKAHATHIFDAVSFDHALL